jgi:glycosyltransferase involved in cell wall biosynthesis
VKNILFIELSSGFGGSSEALYNQLRYMDHKRFHSVVVIAKDGQNFEKMKTLPVEVIKLPFKIVVEDSKNSIQSHWMALVNLFFDLFHNAGLLVKIIKEKDIHLVHINTNIKNNLPSIIAAKITGKPCVCHMRGTRALTRKEKLFGKFTDKLIILNKQAHRILEESFGKDKVVQINDGIDLKSYVLSSKAGQIRDEFKLNGAFVVGTIGRLVEGKGQDDFIRAAALTKKEGKRIKFLVVGSDPDGKKTFENRLKQLTNELSVQDCVIFTGWRSDKNDIISALDVVVQPSSTFPEGAPLICSEAMALYKPVVATNIAGSAEMVENNKTGFLVTPGNPEELAKAIIQLAESPELVKAFGTAGQKRAKEHFDIIKNTTKMENLYQSLC